MELELKSLKKVSGGGQCCCGGSSRNIAEIGMIGNYHGTIFDICDDDFCLEKAFELAAQNLKEFTSPRIFFRFQRRHS